jgi:hypothetical protein
MAIGSSSSKGSTRQRRTRRINKKYTRMKLMIVIVRVVKAAGVIVMRIATTTRAL